MKRNEHLIDRVIRITIGLATGTLILSGAVTGTPAVILGVLATILLLTGTAGFCAIYALLGVSTCGAKKC